jgi:hypothetical protein
MNIHEAYKKAKGLPNNKVLISCLDLGKEWAFCFGDEKYDPKIPMVGGGFELVNKKTGKITFMTPWEDMEKFEKAKVIAYTPS